MLPQQCMQFWNKWIASPILSVKLFLSMVKTKDFADITTHFNACID